jgi:hypothetical protein
MPVHNRATFVAKAVRSALAQSLADFELLVVDDCSDDDSANVVAALGDPRITVLSTERNSGPGAARNLGLRHANGEYVAFLDSDDLARPDRLAVQAAFLDTHPNVGLVGSWTAVIDADDKRLRRVRRYPCTHADIEAAQLFRCCIAQSSVMARPHLLGAQPFDPKLRHGEDWALFLALGKRAQLANIPQALVLSRRHSGQLSADRSKGPTLAGVVAGPMRELGMPATPEKCLRHLELARKGKVDIQFLAWAHDWLQELLTAATNSTRYEHEALASVSRRLWLRLLTRVRPRRAVMRALTWPLTCASLSSRRAGS